MLRRSVDDRRWRFSARPTCALPSHYGRVQTHRRLNILPVRQLSADRLYRGMYILLLKMMLGLHRSHRGYRPAFFTGKSPTADPERHDASTEQKTTSDVLPIV